MSVENEEKDEFVKEVSSEKVIRKNQILINLSNPETGQRIEVVAPKNIRMGVIQTFAALRFGLPPLDVSPTDWKGLAHLLVSFALVLICAALNSKPFFIGLGLLILGYNFYINQNYFRHFIRRKLGEGFVIENQDHMKIVEEANAIPKTSEENKKIKIRSYIVLAILGILSLFFLFSGNTPDYTVTVKDGYLQAFGTDVTIGEVFDFVSNDQTVWTQSELDDARWSSDDFILVEASWLAEMGDLTIQFVVKKKGGNFELHGASLDGEFVDAMTIIYGIQAAVLQQM